MMARFLVCAILTLVPLAGAFADSADEPPVWVQAQQVWESAMTLYTSNRFDQAQGLMEEFVKKFASHEMVPEAYIRIAECRKVRKDPNGHDDAIEEVIRKFPNSWWWFVAYNDKLMRLKAQKKNDDYLATLEAMMKTCKEIPTGLASAVFDWRFAHLKWNWGGLGLEQDILAMCDTPERANKAMVILGPGFRKRGTEMPPEWQFAHSKLLLKAGKDADANRALTMYRDEAGKEPPSLRLLMLIAEDAQARRDDATADATFAYIFKEYGKCGSMAAHMCTRMDYLTARGRTEEVLSMSRAYLERFGRSTYIKPAYGRGRDYAIANILSILNKRAIAGDEAAKEESRSLMDQYYGKKSGSRVQWEIRLALDSNKPQEAEQYIEPMLADSYWSAWTFNMLQAYAKRAPSLSKFVEEARRKYVVPVLEPNSPAGLAYQALQVRMKNNEVRFMEEIIAQIVNDYPDDAATIEAVNAMVNYYYAKAMVPERDKWMDFMIDRYPRHPLTELVLITRVAALGVDKKYEKAAEAMDMLDTRFPTSANRPVDWFGTRLNYYNYARDANGNVARDANGHDAWVRKYYGAACDMNDLPALDYVANLEFWSKTEPNITLMVGNWWMDKAKKFAGTQMEVDCLTRALHAYRGGDYERYSPICWKEARQVVDLLRNQTADTEVKWRMEFGDVNLLSAQRDGKGAVDALNERLTGRRYRNLASRINMEAFGLAIADPSPAAMAAAKTPAQLAVAQAGAVAAAKMEKVCYTRYDQINLNFLMGHIRVVNKANAEALQFYTKVMDDGLWPAYEMDLWVRPLTAFGRMYPILAQQPAQLAPVIDGCVAKCKSVQDVVPRLYLALAQCQMNKDAPGFAATYRKLVDMYPASAARAELEAMMATEAAKKEPAKKTK